MGKKEFALNIMIEREKVNNKDIFIASSPDINVLAEGKSIDEAKKKFLDGVKTHLENFPEDKECLMIQKKEKYEMPMISRIFL